jgi:hypothetical protein
VAGIVCIMDRDSWQARTDVLVLVDGAARQLVWVPRDLYCVTLGDRVNGSWAAGGFPALRLALLEHGIWIRWSVCVRRAATEAFARELTVTVPVDEPLEFDYPLSPHRTTAEASRKVSFRPPAEVLQGMRIHEWIGSRYGKRRTGDLERIRRQQIFVRALLEAGTRFAPWFPRGELVEIAGHGALEELSSVSPSWEMGTLGWLRPRTIRRKMVLVRPPLLGAGRTWRRLRRFLRAPRGGSRPPGGAP